MYDFIYNLWFIYNEFIWWAWEKNPKIYTNENQGKIPRSVALPSPCLQKWMPTVFRCPKTPKTSRTYHRWDWGPNLVGQRNSGLGAEWDNKRGQVIWFFIYMWIFSRSSIKAGWSMVRGTKIMGMGKILRTNDQMTRTMTDNTQLTRFQEGKNNAYLPGMGSRRTCTVDAMVRKRREGWLQHCPLSYDQARCIHPPSAECYAIQAFSIASDFDPKHLDA